MVKLFLRFSRDITESDTFYGNFMVMGLSNEPPGVPPGMRWGFTTLDCPRGREFAI